MEALQLRIRQLAALQCDAFRIHEHNTLDRLMYKSRNQHRCGPYFQRLEHVRRVVRKINNHSAWRFVCSTAKTPASAPAKRSNVISKRRKAKPPVISAETVRSFEKLGALVRSLVEAIIPKAASRITMELICREQFLPFAVTVVAILSRIYVIERALLRTLQGIVFDARIITSIPKNCSLEGKDSSHNRRPAVEDIGEVIRLEDCKDVEMEQPVQLQNPVCLSGASKAGRRMVNRFYAIQDQGTVKNANVRKDPGLSSVAASKGEDGDIKPSSAGPKIAPKVGASLYDLMAEEDPELASIAEAHVVRSERINVGEAEATGFTLRQSASNSTELESKENVGHHARMPGKTPLDAASVDEKSESSESEDLDEIFAMLSE